MSLTSPTFAKLETAVLTFLGVVTLPLLAWLASWLDFGTDPAGDAMLAGAFVFLGTPAVLVVLTLRLIMLHKRYRHELAAYLPFAYVFTWAGGPLFVLLGSAFAADGQIVGVSTQNQSGSVIRNVRIVGAGKPGGRKTTDRWEEDLSQLGGAAMSTSMGHTGYVPVDLNITWTDETGKFHQQHLHIPAPAPLPSRVRLQLSLDETGTWGYSLRPGG